MKIAVIPIDNRPICYDLIQDVLSIDKNQDEYVDIGTSRIKVFPDNADDIKVYAENSALALNEEFETEFATVFVFSR